MQCFVLARPIDHLRTRAGLNAETGGWRDWKGQAVVGVLSQVDALVEDYDLYRRRKTGKVSSTVQDEARELNRGAS